MVCGERPRFGTEDGRAVTHGIGAERPRQSSRTARFEREAKAISSLNHPHTCNLYDIGREHNTEYLVLELLEGETLAARIARGPLPVTQVLRFGIEIAPRDSLSRWWVGGVPRAPALARASLTRPGGAILAAKHRLLKDLHAIMVSEFFLPWSPVMAAQQRANSASSPGRPGSPVSARAERQP